MGLQISYCMSIFVHASKWCCAGSRTGAVGLFAGMSRARAAAETAQQNFCKEEQSLAGQKNQILTHGSCKEKPRVCGPPCPSDPTPLMHGGKT